MSKQATPSPVAEELVQTVLQAVLENAPLPLAQVAGPEHVVWAINPAFCTLLSRSAEELIGQRFADLFPQSTRSSELLDRVLRSGVGEAFVIVEGQAANSHYGAFTCWPINAGIGRLSGLMIQVTETTVLQQLSVAVNEALLISSVQQHELTDVADRLNVRLHDEMVVREELDAALRESQRFLRSSLDALSGHLAVVDASGTILEVNEAWHRFASENGYPTADHGIGSKYLQELTIPDELGPEYAQGINNVLAGKQNSFEFEYPCHSPTAQRWFLMRVTRFTSPGPVRVLIVHDNITERKQAELALRQSEERFRAAAYAARLTYVEVDLAQGGAYTAGNFEAVMGYPSPPEQEADAAIGVRALLQHVVPGDRARVESALQKFVTGGPVGKIEYRVLGDDGIERWIESEWSLKLDDGGQPVKTFATNMDITDRKRSEVALRESAEYNRSITDSSPDCIKILDLEGNLISMADRGQKLLCIPDITPYVNTPWVEFYEGAADRAAALAAVKNAAGGGEGNFLGYFATLDGTPKWWDVRVSPILNANGAPDKLLAVSRDVTERRYAEMNLAFLADISKDLLLLTNIDEMMGVVGQKIGDYLGLSVCAFVEIHEGGDQAVVTHDWHREAGPSFVGVHRMEDFFTAEFQTAGHAGETFVVSDTATDPRASGSNFAAFNVAALITVPLLQDGAWRFMLCAYHSQPYPWRSDEVELIRELTARIWVRLQSLHAEAAVREIDGRLRLALDSAQLGTWNLDPATGLFTVDEPYQAIFGTTGSALLLEEGANSVHPDDRERVANAVEQAMRPDGSEQVEIEYRIVHPDASVHWVLSKGRTAFTQKGGKSTLTGFAGTVADITERKLGEEKLKQNYDSFFALINNAPFAFYIIDGDFRMRHMSKAGQKVFGTVRPLIGRDFEDILHTMWPDALANELVGIFRHTLATGAPYVQPNTTETRNDTQEEESYSWRIEHINLPDGSIGVVCYFFDTTEQKKVEDVLREADRRKSEFLATLAHELRNPLAPLRNGLELLSMADHDRATWDQAHGMMKRQLDQMVRLIDELMDLSRISRGTVDLRLERVDLRTVLEQAVEACKPLIERQDHTLVVDMPEQPVMVEGDAMRLIQVFSNLLNNSAKYTDAGGSIAVRLDQHPEGASITVEDTGIGIAPDQVRKVFDMFAQVERANDRVQGGLGIGLNIVKHLVGMHGGNIDVRSDGLGKGSSFTVHLPVSPEPAKKKAVVGVATGTAKTIAPRRILIVDDNVDAASMMALLLGKQGHELRVAHNGEEALAVGTELEPDVVLMDLGMPIMDGFAACRLMRDTPWGAKALIVALSGWGQDEDRVKSTEAGFDHHLVKPIASEALVRLIAARCNIPAF